MRQGKSEKGKRMKAMNKADESKKHVFIIGSKGIPAGYGGFETFVEKLTWNQINPSIQYYVSCQRDVRGVCDEIGREHV